MRCRCALSTRDPKLIVTGVCGLLLLLLLARHARHSGVTPRPPQQQNQLHALAATPTARAGSSAQPAPTTDEPQPPALPLAGESGSPAARALEDYLAWAKYPPNSQPVSRARQQQRGISTSRRLDLEHRGKVVVRQSQDARYLAPGEAAVVTLSAFVGTQAQRLHISRTRATELGAKAGQRRPTLEHVSVHDDGVPPDRIADDGEVSAQIHAPQAERGAFKGDLRVDMELEAAGELGVVSFAFVCTGDPPARFTGFVREQLEAGSLALYLGLDVFRPGRYIADAILEDANQHPVALLRFNDLLTSSQRELRLVAFGKLLRDSEAVSPYVLREVRAWRQLEAATPDREIVPRWSAVYVTQAYPLAAMSDREWDSTSKARHIEGLRRILAEQ